MKLSAEQFAELASTFNARQTLTRHERRRATRMDLNARVKIFHITNGKSQPPLDILICDFSARGVALLDAKPMDIGQQFVLELPRREGGRASLLCTVVHSKPAGTSNWRIGAEFTCSVQGPPQQDTKAANAEQARIRESMMG